MATFSHLPSGKWRAQVRRAGLYRNATFAKKREAETWAAGIETQAHHIAASGFAPIPQGATLEMLIDKYLETFARSPGKTKAATLRMLKRELGKTKLASLSAVVLRDFIDRRIAEPGEAIKRVADHFEVDESTIAKIFRERRDAVARSGWIVNTNLAQRAGAIRGEQRLGRFARCRHHLPEGGHMMAMTDTSSDNEASIRELARSLDCILDSELQAIGEVKSSTTAAWRRRGKEPAYIVFGNAILYPRAAVAEYLQSLVRARCHESARGPRGG